MLQLNKNKEGVGSMNIKKWSVSPLDKARAAKIAEEMQYPSFLAMLLEIRGFHTKDDIDALFDVSQSFADPFLMKDMDCAAARIQRAIENFESICVYGDYDADGVTSTAMLYSYLESCGANVMFYIPLREQEGYGLNLEALDQLHEQGVQLIVTVDNGIASMDEVAYATQLGMDVVITDHHRPREILPKAVAVVDPHRVDCTYPFKDLSGVGVAFKLITALEGEMADMTTLLENYADFVAIGTIGDIVSLTGENRALVQAGLPLLSHSDRPGICALLEQASMSGKELSSTNVAFTIVPRINATGRIGASDRAVRLLLSEDMEQAQRLAEDICHDNDTRKKIETEITEKALQLLHDEPQRMYERVIVVEGEDWHHGVIGIVSSRITEMFGKPSIVISYTGTEAKASGRSVEGFSLFDAICHCAPLLSKYGGHPMAAGLSMPTEHIAEFRRQINEFAASLPTDMPPQTIHLDCKLNPAALTIDMPKQITYLEPFGTDNPSPVFGLYGMELREVTPIGGGNHLRLRLERNHSTVQCLKFRTALQDFPYQVGDLVDLAVTLEVNEYRNTENLSVFIKDMKLSKVNEEQTLLEYRMYEKVKRGECLTNEEFFHMTPNRDEFAALYRFLRSSNGWQHHILLLLEHLQIPNITLSKLLLALDVLQDQNLIDKAEDGDIYRVTLKPVAGKVDLFCSPILRQLESLRKDG